VRRALVRAAPLRVQGRGLPRLTSWKSDWLVGKDWPMGGSLGGLGDTSAAGGSSPDGAGAYESRGDPVGGGPVPRPQLIAARACGPASPRSGRSAPRGSAGTGGNTRT